MKPWTARVFSAVFAALSLLSNVALANGNVEDSEQEQREAEFARLMSGAQLVGFFVEDGKIERGLQEERYTLGKVSKVEGDKWRFETVIEYGGKKFTMPLVIPVRWAGDTPVISVTDMGIPMIGTFTARVVIHGTSYAGIWGGAGHSGQMFGRVVAAADRDESPAGEASGEGDDDSGGKAPGGSEGEQIEEVGETVHWPTFRGTRANGISEGFPTVAEWDVETGSNIRWKAEIPGLAHSSPVIWGERLYVTTAVRKDGDAELKVGLYGDIFSIEDEGPHTFELLCLDKRSGEIIWRKVAWEGTPHFNRHPKSSFAASTPATDGKHVVAFYGTEGLYCFDKDGELLWERDFGPLDSCYEMFQPDNSQWGFASSPVIHEDKVVVQCDVRGDSFIAVLDLATGEDIWRTTREEVPTWSSPTVAIQGGRSQVICNGFKRIGGYDLATGEALWWMKGGGDIPVPTPVVAHDLIFITNAHGFMAPICAIEFDAEGELDLKHPQMRWGKTKLGNYMQTPIVVGDYLYCCRDNGILACYDAQTGEERYRERLSAGKGGFSASAVAADGKLYLTNEDGEIHVVELGPEFLRIATNDMGEECMATPAISEGVIFWRTRSQVVAVGAL